MRKAVCVGFSGRELEPRYWRELESMGIRRVLATDLQAAKLHPDAEILLVKLGTKISKTDINDLPCLRYIGILGTGYGGIDVEYAAMRNIVVTNIVDYATQAVAEFAFGILLEHLRSISKAKTKAAHGDYSDDFEGTQIRGKTFGIVGLGNIGSSTASLARAFGANVIYWSRNRKRRIEATGIQYHSLQYVLSHADIVCVHLALNRETEKLIDPALINRNATIINLSPMELFDFEALIARLKKQDMTLLLDHTDEMTKAQIYKLKPFKNCILYPPIAYKTGEATVQKQAIFIMNLKNFLTGNPANQVN